MGRPPKSNAQGAHRATPMHTWSPSSDGPTQTTPEPEFNLRSILRNASSFTAESRSQYMAAPGVTIVSIHNQEVTTFAQFEEASRRRYVAQFVQLCEEVKAEHNAKDVAHALFQSSGSFARARRLLAHGNDVVQLNKEARLAVWSTEDDCALGSRKTRILKQVRAVRNLSTMKIRHTFLRNLRTAQPEGGQRDIETILTAYDERVEGHSP